MRPLGGRALLIEELAADAVRIADEDVRSVPRGVQRSIGHREVVADQIQLRVAGLGEQHLAGIGDRDLTAGDNQPLGRSVRLPGG